MIQSIWLMAILAGIVVGSRLEFARQATEEAITLSTDPLAGH